MGEGVGGWDREYMWLESNNTYLFSLFYVWLSSVNLIEIQWKEKCSIP
jgi:hypothetical protein